MKRGGVKMRFNKETLFVLDKIVEYSESQETLTNDIPCHTNYYKQGYESAMDDIRFFIRMAIEANEE